MTMIIILGCVVLLAGAVLGFLYYMLNKEAVAPSEAQQMKDRFKAAPVVHTPLGDPLMPSGTTPAEVVIREQLAQVQREATEKEAAYQNRMAVLENELKDISNKAQMQSQEALNTIDQLKRENEQLRNTKSTGGDAMSGEALMAAQQTIETLQQSQDSLQSRLNLSQEEAQKLQEEVVAVRQQMTREIALTKEENEKLRIDNENLKSSLEPLVTEATKSLQEQIAALRQENETLKSSPATPVLGEVILPVADSSALQSELDELKHQLAALKATNNDLLLANQGLKLSAESANSEAQGAAQELESLKQELEALKSQPPLPSSTNAPVEASADTPVGSHDHLANDLLLANQRIKDLSEQNEHLSERAEALQWDLTKARAQTTSFEKACENYQLQLKEALEKKGS